MDQPIELVNDKCPRGCAGQLRVGAHVQGIAESPSDGKARVGKRNTEKESCKHICSSRKHAICRSKVDARRLHSFTHCARCVACFSKLQSFIQTAWPHSIEAPCLTSSSEAQRRASAAPLCRGIAPVAVLGSLNWSTAFRDLSGMVRCCNVPRASSAFFWKGRAKGCDLLRVCRQTWISRGASEGEARSASAWHVI